MHVFMIIVSEASRIHWEIDYYYYYYYYYCYHYYYCVHI